MNLNIGCGYRKMAGFINIDKSKEVKPDKIVNIENGLPFKDNSISYIYSEHCLEHVRPDKWKFVLNEIARVAANGCILELHLPFDNIMNRVNIDHYRTFGYNSFDQLTYNEKDDSSRNYYSKLLLSYVNPKENKVKRIFFSLFALLKYDIHFIFKIIKKKGLK